MLFSVDIEFNFDDFEPIDKTIELKSWYSRENLLYDTLNPQNIFINRHKNNKENVFIKTDSYVDKVIKHKVIFYDEFIKSFEKFLKIPKATDFIDEKYKENSKIQVFNMTPSLLEIFKHFNSFSYFEENLSAALVGFELNGFKKSNRKFYNSSIGRLETSSIEFLNACNERNIEKLKHLKNLVDIDVCDNRGYSPLIISVVNILIFFIILILISN